MLLFRVKRGCPDVESRVSAVSGDISLPGFGLSNEDERCQMSSSSTSSSSSSRKLTSEVSIIFHSAATIKFDEELTKVTRPKLKSGYAKKLSIPVSHFFIFSSSAALGMQMLSVCCLW